MSNFRIALLGAATAAALGCLAHPAAAADDGYENVFSSVLTAVGVLTPDKTPEIDYRERAPLVVPPKMALEQPLPEGAARTAAWPHDPDVASRRAAAEGRAPRTGRDPDAKLSNEELARGRIADAGGSNIPESSQRLSRCGTRGNGRGCLVLSPDELKAMDERYKASGQGDKKQELAVGEEPDRVYLTQPPKGYMRVTKAVKATTEGPVLQRDESNPASQLVYKPKDDE